MTGLSQQMLDRLERNCSEAERLDLNEPRRPVDTYDLRQLLNAVDRLPKSR